MTPLQGVLILKTIIDVACAMGFVVMRNPPMAIMFAGFAVADFGALCAAQ